MYRFIGLPLYQFVALLAYLAVVSRTLSVSCTLAGEGLVVTFFLECGHWGIACPTSGNRNGSRQFVHTRVTIGNIGVAPATQPGQA